MGIVVGVGQAVGSERNLGLSILATAVVAVGFQPLRDRLQRAANRVVYGRRATPYEVLSEFSGGVGQISAIEELLPKMARLVGEATGATSSEVWLRVGSEFALETASWPVETTAPAVSGGESGVEAIRSRSTAAVPVSHRSEVLGVIAIKKAPGDPLARPTRSCYRSTSSGRTIDGSGRGDCITRWAFAAPVETTAYFVISEALANVAKYSQASSVEISLAQQNGMFEVVVADNGQGGADPERGSGLRGLEDRVAVVDGALDVHSPRGRGTRLMCRIPIPARGR